MIRLSKILARCFHPCQSKLFSPITRANETDSLTLLTSTTSIQEKVALVSALMSIPEEQSNKKYQAFSKSQDYSELKNEMLSNLSTMEPDTISHFVRIYGESLNEIELESVSTRISTFMKKTTDLSFNDLSFIFETLSYLVSLMSFSQKGASLRDFSPTTLESFYLCYSNELCLLNRLVFLNFYVKQRSHNNTFLKNELSSLLPKKDFFNSPMNVLFLVCCFEAILTSPDSASLPISELQNSSFYELAKRLEDDFIIFGDEQMTSIRHYLYLLSLMNACSVGNSLPKLTQLFYSIFRNSVINGLDFYNFLLIANLLTNQHNLFTATEASNFANQCERLTAEDSNFSSLLMSLLLVSKFANAGL